MLAMIVIIVICAIQLIGSHGNTLFFNVASSIQWKSGKRVCCGPGKYVGLDPNRGNFIIKPESARSLYAQHCQLSGARQYPWFWNEHRPPRL